MIQQKSNAMDKNNVIGTKASEKKYYSLILFIVNNGSNSVQARENLKRFCDERLPQRHEIRVVDVLEDFQTALDYNILLTPSVVVTGPEIKRTVHGDLSDTRKFAEALNLNEVNDDV